MINEYSSPIQNTLEQYVPLPLASMYQAASAIQNRGDLAQGQNDQVQTGLSSMEALAPSQRDFVNKFASDFKTQQGALLDKYHGNTSDPQYEQESRRLNMQFAADPRLSIIKQTNELMKKKQAIKDELDAKGMKYIDSNPNFTGADSNGNLMANAGTLASTNFDTNINQAFKDKESAIEQVGHTLTNRRNLGKVHDSFINKDGTLNLDNQDVQQGLSYYKQQGLNDMQAAAKIRNHVDAGLGYAHDLKDHFYEKSPQFQEEMAFKWAELTDKKAKEKQTQQVGPPPFQLLSYPKAIIDNKASNEASVNPNIATPKSEIYNKLKATLSSLDGDNLPSKERTVDDTPENRKKFEGQIASSNTLSYPRLDEASGKAPMNALTLSKGTYDPDQVNMLHTARQMLGLKDGQLSAKQVLTKYQGLMDKFDSSAQDLKSTNNKKLNEVNADVARRQIATGEVYKANNGVLQKVIDPKELSDIAELNDKDVAGMSAKTIGPLNGYTQFNHKGINYYTGIPREYQQQFMGSKLAENYLQDFDPKHMTPIKVTLNDGKEHTAYTDPNDQGTPYVLQGHQGIIKPFKSVHNGQLGAGGLFYYKDQSGNDQVAVVPMSALENEEHTSLNTKVVNDNKIKGD